MKMKSLIIQLIGVLSVFLFLSTIVPPKKCYITKVNDGTNWYEKYFYNKSNRLIKYLSGADEKIIFDYDAQGKCIKTKHFAGEDIDNYTVFEYNPGGQLIKSRYYDNVDADTFQLANYSVYSYDAKKQINKRTDFERDDENAKKFDESGFTNYQYDARGNITKSITYNSDGQISQTTTNEYDDKINPIRNFRLTIFEDELISTNNLTKCVTVNGKGAKIGDASYVYEYNANNYPIKVSQKLLDRKATYQWDYRCN